MAEVADVFEQAADNMLSILPAGRYRDRCVGLLERAGAQAVLAVARGEVETAPPPVVPVPGGNLSGSGAPMAAVVSAADADGGV